MEPIKVILNPYANRGGGARARERIRQILTASAVPFELEETTQVGDAIEMARAARRAGFAVVAAAGGDGTVNEVVNGLARATPPAETVGTLAVLPLGSGNDFSDMLGAPHKLETVVQAIRRGRTRRVDLSYAVIGETGREMGRYFGNNLGVGFEAQVTVESRQIRRLRGFAIYLWAVFRALRQYDQPFIDVAWTDATGKVHEVSQRSLLVSLGNSRRTGGGFYITPDAVMDDGLLDLGIATALSTPRILALLPRVLVGAHRNHPAIRLVRCRSVRIAAHEPVPVHTDGEVITEAARSISVEVQPGRLEVIV